MSTCKYCDKQIYWNQERSIMGEVWRAYEDEDYNVRHRCEDYKPPSKAKREIKEEAKKQMLNLVVLMR